MLLNFRKCNTKTLWPIEIKSSLFSVFECMCWFIVTQCPMAFDEQVPRRHLECVTCAPSGVSTHRGQCVQVCPLYLFSPFFSVCPTIPYIYKWRFNPDGSLFRKSNILSPFYLKWMITPPLENKKDANRLTVVEPLNGCHGDSFAIFPIFSLPLTLMAISGFSFSCLQHTKIIYYYYDYLFF